MQKLTLSAFFLLLINFCWALPTLAETESRSVGLEGAETVSVELSCAVGEISLAAGASDLLEATFRYSHPDWRPQIEYSRQGAKGHLEVEMETSVRNLDDADDNQWQLRFSDKVPLDLELELGVGKGEFDFRQLHLKELALKTGVGEFAINLAGTSVPKLKLAAGLGQATVDLSGPWHNDLEADFTCGMGQLKLILPQQVGVEVEVEGLLGSVEAPGLFKKNNTYTNAAFHRTEHVLRISIAGVMGRIEMSLAD